MILAVPGCQEEVEGGAHPALLGLSGIWSLLQGGQVDCAASHVLACAHNLRACPAGPRVGWQSGGPSVCRMGGGRPVVPLPSRCPPGSHMSPLSGFTAGQGSKQLRSISSLTHPPGVKGLRNSPLPGPHKGSFGKGQLGLSRAN